MIFNFLLFFTRIDRHDELVVALFTSDGISVLRLLKTHWSGSMIAVTCDGVNAGIFHSRRYSCKV